MFGSENPVSGSLKWIGTVSVLAATLLFTPLTIGSAYGSDAPVDDVQVVEHDGSLRTVLEDATGGRFAAEQLDTDDDGSVASGVAAVGAVLGASAIASVGAFSGFMMLGGVAPRVESFDVSSLDHRADLVVERRLLDWADARNS